MKSTQQIKRSAGCPKSRTKKCFFSHSPIQAKSNIDGPADKYEKEADIFSEKVIRMTETNSSFFQKKLTTTIPSQKEKFVSLSKSTYSSPEEQVLNAKGQPLDNNTRSFMEQRFGHDFGDVQIHNDSLAHQSSESLQAEAYTFGNHIAFNNGKYSPQTENGKKLLAHELTHVVQQRSGVSKNTVQRCATASEVPLFDSLVIGIRSMSEYKSLSTADKKLWMRSLASREHATIVFIYL